MCAMKTPGVYVVEKNAFPNSVVEVATAVPAFIGYTQKALNGASSLTGLAWRITSLAEYEIYFGIAPNYLFNVDVAAIHPTSFAEITIEDPLKCVQINRVDQFSFYQNLRFFFTNGGGSCYIVSVGSYTDELNRDVLIGGLVALLKEQEPTIVVVPEAVNLKEKECYDVHNAVLAHCGNQQNRFAILDVYDGYKDRNDAAGDVVSMFREQITAPVLSYGASYYPWLNTSVVSLNELSFLNIQNDDLASFKAALKLNAPTMAAAIDKMGPALETVELQQLHQLLFKQSPIYAAVIKEMLVQLNLMPTASAMAGIYSLVDLTREVWKAPANIAIAGAISTAVDVSFDGQQDLNLPLDGKAINAIRYFLGEGIKIWGARTLDGNSLDWRYINVRRTMIMLEQSIKNAVKAYVFEPNTANTWVAVQSVISNFLTGIWKRGGLAGAVPADAFSVQVGLGATMTPQDILEGMLRITVLVAVSRPGEFIEITFQQQMQKS